MRCRRVLITYLAGNERTYDKRDILPLMVRGCDSDGASTILFLELISQGGVREQHRLL